MDSMMADQICMSCVMDTTDTKITFDENGVCDHCNDFKNNVMPDWDTSAKGVGQLRKQIDGIKKHGENKDFDCILGMSGGADSSYLLHLVVKEFGLRPLVFHVDGGWNSDIAVSNIKVMVDKLGLDLYTEVINWEDMKEFQLGYFRSGLPNIDVPQDHAFVATLYNFADKYGIKYILNGGNISTECVRNPLDWLYYGTDMLQLNYIRKKFVNSRLENYPFSSVFRHKLYLRYVRGVKVIKPLDSMPYIKQDAMNFLQSEYGWRPYPQKHFESRFTKFYEGYWLPKRFGFDTRKVQYSSLILTGQMTRNVALEKLALPALSDEDVRKDFQFIAKKLQVDIAELTGFLEMPLKSHRDYPNQQWIFNLGAKCMKWLGLERSIKR
jgi:N-acetyl sugar amidotransferase